MDHYTKKIAALNRVACKIREIGGLHHRWNIRTVGVTIEEDADLIAAGWCGGEGSDVELENGWTYYTFA